MLQSEWLAFSPFSFNFKESKQSEWVPYASRSKDQGTNQNEQKKECWFGDDLNSSKAIMVAKCLRDFTGTQYSHETLNSFWVMYTSKDVLLSELQQPSLSGYISKPLHVCVCLTKESWILADVWLVQKKYF